MDKVEGDYNIEALDGKYQYNLKVRKGRKKGKGKTSKLLEVDKEEGEDGEVE